MTRSPARMRDTCRDGRRRPRAGNDHRPAHPRGRARGGPQVHEGKPGDEGRFPGRVVPVAAGEPPGAARLGGRTGHLDGGRLGRALEVLPRYPALRGREVFRIRIRHHPRADARRRGSHGQGDLRNGGRGHAERRLREPHALPPGARGPSAARRDVGRLGGGGAQGREGHAHRDADGDGPLRASLREPRIELRREARGRARQLRRGRGTQDRGLEIRRLASRRHDAHGPLGRGGRHHAPGPVLGLHEREGRLLLRRFVVAFPHGQDRGRQLRLESGRRALRHRGLRADARRRRHGRLQAHEASEARGALSLVPRARGQHA